MTDDAVLARLDRLEAEVAGLRAENQALRDQATSAEVPPPPAAPAAARPAPGLGRRAVMTKGLAAAGAATAGAVLLNAQPAAAANGNAIIIGAVNTGSTLTQLNGSTFYNAVGSGVATYSISSSGIGSYQQGGTANMWFADTSRNPPTGDSISHSRGEVVFDRFGQLWLCVVAGTPGTWRTMGGNGGAGVFYPFPAPQRTYDSRPGTTPTQGPKTKLSPNVTRIISLANVGATSQPPAGVSLSILLVNAAAGSGNFTVWSADAPLPQSNTLVWGGNAGRFTTLAYSSLDEAGRINIRSNLATDVVIDVVGFYR